MNGFYESRVLIAERQAAEAVKKGNIRTDTLLLLPSPFDSFSHPIFFTHQSGSFFFANLSSPAQLAAPGH